MPFSEVVSTLHGRPRKSTHFNTIRAERTPFTLSTRMLTDPDPQAALTMGSQQSIT